MMLLSVLLCVLLTTQPALAAWVFTADNVAMADNAVQAFPDADWSICGFFKLANNTGSGNQNLWGWGAQSANPSFNLYIREASNSSPNALTSNPRDNDTGSAVSIAGTPGTSTAWQRVCAVRTGTATVTNYINGASIGTGSSATFDGIDVAGSSFFGVDGDGSGEPINDGGLLVVWAKWDRALSADVLVTLN
jgi:hypothetical protein